MSFQVRATTILTSASDCKVSSLDSLPRFDYHTRLYVAMSVSLIMTRFWAYQELVNSRSMIQKLEVLLYY